MKRRIPLHAFTLIEMVTVVTVIVILAGLVISVAGFVQNKGAREKTLTQIKNLNLQCEAYKIDNGSYPRNDDTDKLDPRTHLSPISGSSAPIYKAASRFLYASLSGDFEPPQAPDGIPEVNQRTYYNFKRDELNFNKSGSGGIGSINYLQDPFGNCFGYSTIGAMAEEAYRIELRKAPDKARPSTQQGYNHTFDLWSTGGASASSGPAKWIKNWGS